MSRRYRPIRRAEPTLLRRWLVFGLCFLPVLFGFELIMKVFRRVDPGINPDVEIGKDLRTGADAAAAVVGADGGQAVGYFLSVPGRRFSGGR